MDEWFGSFTSLVVCAIVLGLFYWYRRPKNMPPGPRGIPLFGVIPFIGSHPERKLAEWGKTYGPIMSVRFGRQDWIVLNNYDVINEAFVKSHETFSGRPKLLIIDVLSGGNGLILIDGHKWKAQRKFGMITLRDFGMGKHSMEDSVLEEVEYMNEEIRKHQGKPFLIKDNLENAVSNVTCKVVFGRRFHYNDPWFTNLLHIMQKWVTNPKMSRVLSMLTFAPILQYFPPFSGYMKELLDDINTETSLFEEKVKEHEEDFQKHELRDFIDAFLVEMREGKDTFTHIQLLHYIRDLFVAGTETSASFLAWSILCLVHYPEAQKKLYEEIIKVIGESGKPAMSLKDDMPYSSAFIQEVMRYRTLGPLGIYHSTSADTNLGKYFIPKDTTVIPNVWGINNDPNLWDEAEKFKPERHLDCDGRFVKSNYVIPFSIGPRHCLAKPLAQIEVFIFLISMVQKFEFLPAAGKLPNIVDGSKGTVFSPCEFEIVANER